MEGWRQHEARFRLLLADLGWTRQDLFHSESSNELPELVECPYNPSHRVPPSSLPRHAHKCCLRVTGLPPPEGPNGPSALFYEGAPGVVRLNDDDVTHTITTTTTTSTVPAQADLGPTAAGAGAATRGNELRLRRYDEATQAAKLIRQQRPDCKGLDIDLFAVSQPATAAGGQQDASSSGTKTRAQLLAEERDYRRRTKKYRARNVHITKRSPIQVARDFINNRMEELVAIIEGAQPATATPAARGPRHRYSKSPARATHQEEEHMDSAWTASPHHHRRLREIDDHRTSSDRRRDKDEEEARSRKRQRTPTRDNNDNSRCHRSTRERREDR